jgi:PAS domain S-box-containing protein
MRALKPIRSAPAGVSNCFENLLAQFSAATLELNPAIGAKQISQRLTERVAEMFGARAAILALAGTERWEIAAFSGLVDRADKTLHARLAKKLGELASVSMFPSVSESAPAMLGYELAAPLGWRELALARLTDREGKALGVLCVADLTRALSPTEKQLLEALASHASVALENVRMIGRIELSRKQWVEDVDAISDFIVVHDASGKVLRLNRALADLLKVHPTAVIGWDVASLGLLATKAEGRCPFCQNLNISKEELTYQAERRTYVISTSRINSEDGGVRTIHVLKDITERREAERRYRRERDFNKNILNNTQNMILVLDTAGLISYSNRRCSDAGYCEQDLLGHPLAEFVAPGRRPMYLEALGRTLEGMPAELELPFTRPTSGSRQLAVSLSPMRDEQGDINSVVVVMSDITDSLDLQAKMMHNEKMAALGQLVSGVAHEVNNPLAAIVGFTDLLLEHPGMPDAAKQDLQVILREAQRTRVIVQNLLSFARQMPSRHEPLQVNSIVRQTLELRSYEFARKGVEVVQLFDKDLPLLVGDPHQLQQVFLNVLNNAYDAIQEVRHAGKIEIKTSHSEGQIEIAFRDNGPGISHPDRIFDPFFTTKDVGKGTGLGLSICYGIIREHRGEIRARNNDGHGCTFTVRLPMAKTSTAVLMAEAAR